jgi:nucleotide-binding universal stress UspA family protein
VRMAVIVVGVDGSEGAQAALAWAAAEARLRGARLRAVHAWHLPAAAYGSGGFVPPIGMTWEDDLADAAKGGLEKALGEAAGILNGIEVEHRIGEGSAAVVLTEAAEDADLLVIGSRGLGGFKELLLGSVGHQCAQRSPCPVVIVRGRIAHS